MSFYLVQNNKRILLSDSLSLVKFVNVIEPIEVVISGVLKTASVAANGLLISTDGANWTDVISSIDFRVEFEPKIFVSAFEDSTSGTIEILFQDQ